MEKVQSSSIFIDIFIGSSGFFLVQNEGF